MSNHRRHHSHPLPHLHPTILPGDAIVPVDDGAHSQRPRRGVLAHQRPATDYYRGLDLDKINWVELPSLFDVHHRSHDPSNGPVPHALFYRDGTRFCPRSGRLYLMDGGCHLPFDPRVHSHIPDLKLITADGGFAGYVSDYRPPIHGGVHQHPPTSNNATGGIPLPLPPSTHASDPHQALTSSSRIQESTPSDDQLFTTRSLVPDSDKTASGRYRLPELLQEYTNDRVLGEFFERAIAATQLQGVPHLKREFGKDWNALNDEATKAEEVLKELLEKVDEREEKDEDRYQDTIATLEEEEEEKVAAVRAEYDKKKKDRRRELSKAKDILAADKAMLEPGHHICKRFTRLCHLCYPYNRGMDSLKDILQNWKPGDTLFRGNGWLLNPVACQSLMHYLIPKDTLHNFGMLDFALLFGLKSHDEMTILSRDQHIGGLKLLALLQVFISFPNYIADVKNHMHAGVLSWDWSGSIIPGFDPRFHLEKANDEVLAENFAAAFGGCLLTPNSRRGPLRVAFGPEASPYEEGTQERTSGERLSRASGKTRHPNPSTDGFLVDPTWT